MSTQPGPANPAISLSTAPEPYVDVKRAASYLSVAVKTLNEMAKEFRHELSQVMRMRRVPELRFRYDDSVDRGERIEALLRGKT